MHLHCVPFFVCSLLVRMQSCLVWRIHSFFFSCYWFLFSLFFIFRIHPEPFMIFPDFAGPVFSPFPTVSVKSPWISLGQRSWLLAGITGAVGRLNSDEHSLLYFFYLDSFCGRDRTADFSRKKEELQNLSMAEWEGNVRNSKKPVFFARISTMAIPEYISIMRPPVARFKAWIPTFFPVCNCPEIFTSVHSRGIWRR